MPVTTAFGRLPFAPVLGLLTPKSFSDLGKWTNYSEMNSENRMTAQIFWILRIGVAMEFIGHGALGLLHLAPTWTSYFAVVGISKDTALRLMPIVGAFDISMALAALFYPMRGLILYMAAWGLWTALLRPLAGESAWEAVERAGNVGAPLALFLLAKGGARSWSTFRLPEALDGATRRRLCRIFQWSTVLLLLGHGLLGLWVRKPLFGVQYAAIGLHGSWIEPVIGGFECALALAVLVQPAFGLLLFVLAWKLATEALSPMAGAPIWVFIEHGGSYAAPLALALLQQRHDQPAAALLQRTPA
jgi:hypothetical protein